MTVMNPLELLAWVGSATACVILLSIASLAVWAVVQTMRGKPITSGRI